MNKPIKKVQLELQVTIMLIILVIFFKLIKLFNTFTLSKQIGWLGFTYQMTDNVVTTIMYNN